jgi:hypothetical protein
MICIILCIEFAPLREGFQNMEPDRIPHDHELQSLNCVPLPINNNFSGSRPHQITLTEQINPRLVQGDNAVPLARASHREDLRWFDCHLDPNLFQFRRQKVGNPSKMSHREVKQSGCVRRQCWCTVELGRQILRESSRTDENGSGNGNGNSARTVNIASSTGLRSTSGVPGAVAYFRPEN